MNRLSPKNDAERHEKKANNLVPKTMDRFNNGRDDVLQKRTPLAHGLTLPHSFIVTKAIDEGFRDTEMAKKVPLEARG